MDQAVSTARPVADLVGIDKTFGTTRANADVSLSIGRGEIVGLIGSNGAGKSTLMRVLSGILPADRGAMQIDGTAINLAGYSPLVALARGVRMVHQELSLCDSLTVYENFYLENASRAGNVVNWRAHYREFAAAGIEAIFPGSAIDVGTKVRDLTLANRQMVEIARAASDPNLKLLILDEPTSSLDAQGSAALQRYIKQRAEAGVSFIFVTHKLREVVAATDRVVVMRGGSVVWSGATRDTSVAHMVELMAGDARATRSAREGRAARAGDEAVLCEIRPGPLTASPLNLRRGEVIGVAGLEGQGQRVLLRAIYEAARNSRRRRDVTVSGAVTYVSGDRVREGNFPLWSVLKNATITRFAQSSPFERVRPAGEQALAEGRLREVRIDVARMHSLIGELSGGNQQKVLMARAFVAESDIIVLDDPTRGVDVAVKREFYRLIASAADSGKLIVWSSSEDNEFLECDRALVMEDGRIREELVAPDITEDRLVAAYFRSQTGAEARSQVAVAAGRRGVTETLIPFIPFLTLLLAIILVTVLNPNAFSLFGAELILSAAIPLILISMGQMFIVGGSEIDLGIGAFAGLINVLTATILFDNPLYGVGALAATFAAYCLMGQLIRARRIPAIVVTLGASFVWSGIGYIIQPAPGGGSPAWLSAIVEAAPFGIPSALFALVIIGAAAFSFNRSRTGVVLRAFGNNPRALEQQGWSPAKSYLVRYGVAAGCALVCGAVMTASNYGSDINAGGSYTLLAVAGVVIGGCKLAGGYIRPIGVVCSALTLSLVGVLLGSMGVGTDFNAAVQGGLLIGILIVRRLIGESAAS